MLDGLFADRQSLSDLPVCTAGYEGVNHFEFTWCQVEPPSRSVQWLGVPQSIRQTRCAFAINPVLSRHDGIDTVEEVLRRGTLEQYSTRTILERLDGLIILDAGGQ